MFKQAFYSTVLIFFVNITYANTNDNVKISSVSDQAIIEIEISESALIELETTPSTVLIADPDTADVYVSPDSPNQVTIIAKKIGETRLQITDKSKKVIADYRIAVTPDLSQIRQTIRNLIKEEIDVKAVAGGVALVGKVSSAKVAEDARQITSSFVSESNVLNLLQITQSNQVNLRVRVMEVSREISRDIGVNWDILSSSKPNISLSGRTLGTGRGTFTSPPTGALTNSFFAGGGFRAGQFSFDALLNFLDEEGLVTVISEPNLTTLSGEMATFLAGGEFPVPVPDSDGRVTIEFKQFGVSLAFTPTVVEGRLINLHVRPEVSQLVFGSGSVEVNGFNIPSLTTRRTETTVELESGQSFSIAGLLQNNISQTIQKVPGLANLPILGALFRSESFTRNETELVILVTPYLVQPFSETDIVSPAEGLGNQADNAGRQNIRPAGFLF